MKIKATKLACLFFALSGMLLTAAPMGSSFTYQGRYLEGGNPANGLYEFQFTLYDAVSSGNAVAGPITQNAVPVANGLFTTALDFGNSAFNGDARWLEIAVRTNGSSGSFGTFLPRQKISPSPCATYAATSGSAATVQSGQVVKSLNGLTDVVTLSAGTNITITPSGNGLQISATGGGAGLSLPYSGNASTGGSLFELNNSGTGPAATFLGRVGVGTNNPGAALDIAGNVRASSYYNFNGNPPVPTTVDAAIFNQANLGPTISGLGFEVRTGPTPASSLRIDSAGKSRFAADVGIGYLTAGAIGSPGYGTALSFSGGPHLGLYDSDNSDPLWIARYNDASNQSELRVNIGDDYGPLAVESVDSFVVGVSDYTVGGQWRPVPLGQQLWSGSGRALPRRRFRIIRDLAPRGQQRHNTRHAVPGDDGQ